MSVDVPTKEAFDALATEVATLKSLIDNLPSEVELTSEEKAAIQTVLALINRLIGGS